MSKGNRVLILLVLVGFCFTATANAELAITEIMSQSAHSGTTDGDWWELTNTSLVSVDLTGYSWDDDDSHGPPVPGTVTFGSITIGAGESIIILDDTGSSTALWKSQWALAPGVNVYDHSHFTGGFSGLGGSDGIALFDASDVLVTSVTYPNRATGISNEWGTDGTFLGLSVVGENGAYQSVNASPDVASPGHTVQSEPCSSSGRMIYWTDKDTAKIQRMNLDSGCLEDILTDGDGLANPRGLAIDTSSNKMYWSDGTRGEIHRANLDGSGNELLLAGLSYPTDLALDTENSKIYFSETGQARIRKVNIDGTGPIENVITGTGVPYYLTLDLTNSRIYWADVQNTVIRRANLDGTGIDVFISGLTHVRDIVLDVPGNKIYWGDRGSSTIQRANLNDGSGIEILYGPTGLDRPHGLLLDDTDDTLYWTDTNTTAVYRGNKEGTAPMETLASGLDGPWALAIVMVREIKYVDADATGANDGASWEDAFNHLQDALSAAGSGDEIRVAQGIYKPDEDTDNPTGTGDREATFQLKNGVTVKGGYAGFGEPDPDAWDVELYETILSGDLSGNDGANFVNNDENSYHIVNGTGTNSTAVLDGFIITGGNANGSFKNAAGGGMYMDDYSSPTVLNCTFRGNSAINGGGMFIEEGGTSIIKNCIFGGNSASNYGGGLYGEDECDYTLVNSIFTGNMADFGGGMYNFGGDMSRQSLTNCTFYNNWARSNGGGIYNTLHSSSTLTNCIFWGNGDSSGRTESSQIYGYNPDINYSCIQGWTGALGGTGNIDADPLFVDPRGLDDIPGTQDDNLRLLSDSPCIGAGDNSAVPAGISTDLDGNARIVDNVDMGAYEFQGTHLIYVDADAAGANNGQSWADAYTSLAVVLMDAMYPYEIMVAQGTYRPNDGVVAVGDERELTFQLKNGVTVKGGYAGYGAPDPNARDIELYETILSGDLLGNDAGDLDYPSLDDPSRDDNSYHVVTGSGTNATAVLDGFTITGGNGYNSNGIDPSDRRGGGMYNYQASPTITNCNFIRNSAHNSGGGIYNMYSNPILTNCTFTDNFGGFGGGMYNDESNSSLTNCLFIANTAIGGNGGGMNNYRSNPTITNCTFNENDAYDIGNSMYNSESNPILTNCIVWGDGFDEIHVESGAPIVTYSDIQGGWPGLGNIDVDPMFGDPHGPDGIVGTEDDNLRLLIGSPCIDSGDNSAVTVTTDLDGNERIVNNFVDMGAYEFHGVHMIYVDADATGANDGSSWENAFSTYFGLQLALGSAAAGDEIRVAQGTYKPDITNGIIPPSRSATFQLKNGVKIKGGYAGFGEPNPDARDIELYETILSGDLNGDDGPDFTNYAENSYHVVIASDVNASAVLDGFTVSGGNADDSSHPNNNGGGMYCTSEATISNCTFTENFAVYGGGMACHPTWCCVTYPTLDNCTFIGNSAEDGGAMFISDSDPALTNCVFIGNSASNDGGAVMYYMDSIPILNNCLFSQNQAAHDGGGIFLLLAFNINITNSTFGYNSAGNLGGGIYQSDASTAPQINNCILWGNTDIGGADETAQVYPYYGNLSVDYSCIQGWTGSLGGTANHGDDPLFVDANGVDDIAGTEDDNLRLSHDSPCIDHGDNAAIPVEVETDLDGRPRIIDGDCNDTEIVDMGAYEFNFAYMGDFDNDCEVGFDDFAILAQAWLTEAGDVQWNPACDIGIPNDSSINMPDLYVFIENWLEDNNP